MSISNKLGKSISSGRDSILQFSDAYKYKVFTIWYNNGKPSNTQLYGMIPEEENTKEKVDLRTLKRWITNEFSVRAMKLDADVIEQMDQTMVQDKVVMLKRHAEIAQKMQDEAWEYLEEHGLGNARNALTMLIRGIEIERDSRSVPKFLAEISKKTDAELIEDIRQITHGDNVIDLEPDSPEE